MELELIDQLNVVYDRYWVIYQWWTSVAIGVLLMAHFASERLTILTTAFLVILYSIYSAWLFGMLMYNIESAGAALDQLRILTESGATEYAISKVYVNSDGIAVLLGVLAPILLFIGSLSYLIFRYREHRGST